MRNTLPLLLSLATLGPACSSPQTNETTTDLDTARMLFTRPLRSSYSFTWQLSCFCAGDQVRPIRISVANGEITRAMFVDDHQPVAEPVRGTLKTIQGVFETIQTAIDGQYDQVDVEYDADLGFPALAYIDKEHRIADDEYSLALSDFATPADAP